MLKLPLLMIRKVYILLIIVSISISADNVDIHGSIASDINATGDIDITTIINPDDSIPLDLRFKISQYLFPNYLLSSSLELELNNMFFVEGGASYNFGSTTNRNYRILSEYNKGEIPDDRLFGFLTVGIRHYFSNSLFLEVLGGGTYRNETSAVQPYLSSSIGVYSYEEKIKNFEISIGVMYHDIGHSDVDFNDFGNASFEVENMEWDFIFVTKWFWASQYKKDKR